MSQWWKTAVFYEVYMPSFADSNGDGIGDFAGVTSKLDYLEKIGINGLWLTPFYKSPKIDNGYDIADYYTIDEDYGTMEDFHQFIKEAHKRGIKVIADLVLNHTSSEHEWFKSSRSSKENIKRDWYIWKDSVNSGTPNNWESFFGGSAWEYDETTGQYYYHAFAKEQVDLNWSNPEVKKEMFEVMKFWLDQGIDGFRLDVINFLTMNDSFSDNPFDENGVQIHQFDKDQDGMFEIIKEISNFVHSFEGKFIVGEVGSDDLHILKQYCGNGKLDVVFNFNFGSTAVYDADRFFSEINEMETTYTVDQIPTLFFGSHDMSRFISRFGKAGAEEDRAKLLATLMLTAKGVPFIYYGDEIGMRDLYIDCISEMKDVQGITAYELALKEGKSPEEAIVIANDKGRDKSRSPMQWSRAQFGGFSEVKPWIALSEHIDLINVENQMQQRSSILLYYKSLISLRKQNEALSLGNYQLLNKLGDMIFYIRESEGNRVLVLLNFGEQKQTFDSKEYGIVQYEELLSSNHIDFMRTSEIIIGPYEARILKIK